MDNSHLDVTIIVPVKDEQDNIVPLAKEIDDTMSGKSWRYETLWIDDGSNDGSGAILDTLAQSPLHRVIHFETNMGQSAAMWYGFQRARGLVVATLDGDGQNDPRDLPTLIEKVLSGDTDMANGFRAERQDNSIRKIASRIANGFRNWMTGKTVRDVGCSIRAIRRECVLHLPLFKGMHRFLPTMVVAQGYRIDESPVNHRPRQRGQTKYTIGNRLWVGIWDTFGIYWLQYRGFYKNIRTMRDE